MVKLAKFRETRSVDLLDLFNQAPTMLSFGAVIVCAAAGAWIGGRRK